MSKPDPHPWSPKDGRELDATIEHDSPGLLAIGIAMLAGLVCVAAALLAGLIYGAIALWDFAARLIT